jgi:hypothetical protein
MKILRTQFIVKYQVEQTYLKIRTVGKREEMSCHASFGFSQHLNLTNNVCFIFFMKNKSIILV